ncbi:hypothetical protein [Aquabacterium sp.]|uniref:hypothetical protein n=1 Tax=Aquabacterium sp. TaxID=1872578 RepID=UPI0025B7D406|nr:hypothetical protein [Aquabacterium sp.]
MKGWRGWWVAGWLWVLSAWAGHGVFAASVAPLSNLLRNPGLQGVPGEAPKDTFHGISYDLQSGRRDPAGTLTVGYRYGQGPSGRAHVDVELVNRSGQSAHYTLFLSSQRRPVQGGERLCLSAQVSAQGVQAPVILGLGFQFYRADDAYLSDFVPATGEYKVWVGESQVLSAGHVSGEPDPGTGVLPGSLYPRLSVYNIPAGATVRLRVSDVTMTAERPRSEAEVLPLSRPIPALAPGQIWPLTVEVAGRPGQKGGRSRLSLVDTQGKVGAVFDSAQPLGFVHGGVTRDVWRPRLPRGLPVGTYGVVYEVPDMGLKRRLGEVQVRPSAGMWLGMAFHRYPGRSEASLGPLRLRYQFARSLASDETYLTQWWTGPDQYDWRGVTRWAHFHAQPGERRLVFTFSGSPRWASAQPDQPAAMGLPGNAAPPAMAYRGAYQRMVRETLLRFKGRVLASECWNEPNNPAFFTGTQTDLADLCKAVAIATKAVDPKVLVICPQADKPGNLDIVYSARTSDGEPIHQFCDLVGSHVYDRLAQDRFGRDYGAPRLRDALDDMVAMGRKHGVNKPLAVTEYGLSSCLLQPGLAHPTVFGRMPSEEAAEALYDAIAEFRAFGVSLLALYSFDHESNDPRCRPGGSFIRMTQVDPNGTLRLDPVMVRRVSEATADFGRVDHE